MINIIVLELICYAGVVEELPHSLHDRFLEFAPALTPYFLSYDGLKIEFAL